MAARAANEPIWRPGLAGLAAGAMGLGISELIAGLIKGAPSLVSAVGSLVIALQPSGAKDLMASLFGTNDKLVLNLAVLAVGLLAATLAGTLAARQFRYGIWVFAGFGVLAAVAAWNEPLISRPFALFVPLVAVFAGLLSLAALLQQIPGSSVARLIAAQDPAKLGLPSLVARKIGRSPVVKSPARRAGTDGSAQAAATSLSPKWTRRRFLIASAVTVGAAAVAGGVGRMLLNAQYPSGAVSTSRLPAVLNPVPSLTAAQSFPLPGLTPIVTPNDSFYKIDTTLLTPQVDANAWTLEVKGLVDHPLTFTYDQLLAIPLFEQYVTIACVSNDVAQDNQPGLNLVGNARWTGVRLRDVLTAAGVQAGASQIVGRSVDDFTVGFPTSWAMDPSREPMIAIGMNGLPLPADHGYPARLIVPGLYGYVSATKWLASIELTTREAVDGYWIPLGWAKDGPILTQSRIDVPAGGANLAAGLVTLAGVAWAPDRGIVGVEVSLDSGPWQDATISQPISATTWVQWELNWNATKGAHSIEVRATDGTGVIQTATVSAPAPDGARGHHRITVNVS